MPFVERMPAHAIGLCWYVLCAQDSGDSLGTISATSLCRLGAAKARDGHKTTTKIKDDSVLVERRNS